MKCHSFWLLRRFILPSQTACRLSAAEKSLLTKLPETGLSPQKAMTVTKKGFISEEDTEATSAFGCHLSASLGRYQHDFFFFT